ncbi:hypothetical protein MAJJADAN_00054 [Pseudomonas phage Amjad_SA]|nr:hypothetical protein MAJJADAN_00054 [Pseudomonas phage Amjad_SA]
MTRITNAIRDEIVSNAVAKSGILEVIKQLDEKRFDWIERARIEVLGGEERAAEYAKINDEAKSKHDALPEYMREFSRLVNRDGLLYLNLAGASLRLPMRAWAEVPNGRRAITADNPLCQEFYDLEDALRDATSKRNSIRQQVTATVGKFTTVKRLLDAWPEAKELLPKLVPEAKPQLPAVQVADLNAMLGLPSDK